jgi:hypothetical protein
MRLSERTLLDVAVTICGDKDAGLGKHFPYRSSSLLTRFFHNCGVNEAHDGSTRKYWVLEVLKKVNGEAASLADLPSDSMIQVLTELMDPGEFEGDQLDRNAALTDLNKAIGRHGLIGSLDAQQRFYLRHDGSGASSTILPHRPRPLSPEEQTQRKKLAAYLDAASEDEFTEKVLVPFFQRMGFYRVTAGGHREKLLEFGKDLWMKFQLPTGHWLYFCAQVKRVKIDAKGVSGGNVPEVLNQAKMAIGHAIFDPESNRTVLLDHLFIISASDITRQARQWLIEKLDHEQRRHIIFMDRDEFLNHAARIVADLALEDKTSEYNLDDVPF